jgi:hypothetical protein
MTAERFSWRTDLAVAVAAATEKEVLQHLLRDDGQEDVCFATWHPSTGAASTTAVLHSLVLPRDGERNVHGNADFTSEYFLRAAGEAAANDAGLALMHSHPGGHGWQGLSSYDFAAEVHHAAQTASITGLPLLGMTLAGDKQWSARFWSRTAPRMHEPKACLLVRTVGERMCLSFNPTLSPAPRASAKQLRTVSAWGAERQADIARMRVGIIGAGSVGSLVAEALVRTGVRRLAIIDFDTLQEHNLDRQLHASPAQVGLAKAAVLAEALRASTTSEGTVLHAYEDSVCEPSGFQRAIDCDVLFSCVDRPWPRAVLNLIAYAHLVPVIDGGVLVDARQGRFRGAHWRAHSIAPGRQCLECLGQYDPGLVQADRDGLLDDPAYIDGLPADHLLRRNENVFGFSMACAGLELAQFICMVTAPSGIADPGAQHYNLTTGTLLRDESTCSDGCPYSSTLFGLADDVPIRVTAHHPTAEQARLNRSERPPAPGSQRINQAGEAAGRPPKVSSLRELFRHLLGREQQS